VASTVKWLWIHTALDCLLCYEETEGLVTVVYNYNCESVKGALKQQTLKQPN
jgi:hypothetical protein